MTSEQETLTRLVAGALDDGLTYRALERKAVDPETGYRPARATIWKVVKGQSIQLTPELVRAIAAGLGVPATRAQRAAAFQYAGYVPQDVDGATVLRDADAPDVDLAAERDIVARWDKDAGEQRNLRRS